jgi:hypothetical protein
LRKRVFFNNDEIALISAREEKIISAEDESTIQHRKREQVLISTEEESANQY